MDLDEMKTVWAENDSAFAAILRLDRVRSATDRATRRIGIDIVFDAIALLLIGSYLGEVILQPKFAVPGILLQAFALALLISHVRQLVAIRTIDYARPVLEIAKTFAATQASRARWVRWILLTGPLLWVPLTIVGFKAFFGIDAYAFGTAYLAWNLAFGAAFLGVGAWLAYRYGNRVRSALAFGRRADAYAID